MALIKCSECDNQVSDKADKCPHCGNPINLSANIKTKFCKHCGEKINADAIICIKCGRQVEELKKTEDKQSKVIINNTNKSANLNTNVNKTVVYKTRHKHSCLIDLFMICITGGLWIIWMIIRPK